MYYMPFLCSPIRPWHIRTSLNYSICPDTVRVDPGYWHDLVGSAVMSSSSRLGQQSFVIMVSAMELEVHQQVGDFKMEDTRA
jgi:hypothetical protein